MIPIHVQSVPVLTDLVSSPWWVPICLFAGLLIYQNITEQGTRNSTRRVVIAGFLAFIAASSLTAAIIKPIDICEGLDPSSWGYLLCRIIYG